MANQAQGQARLKAPAYGELPKARHCAARYGPELCELRVSLEVTTPIFGGGYQTRALDGVDTIRVPSIRGHLRFWWRALYASKYGTSKDLYKREGKLWGCPATGEEGKAKGKEDEATDDKGGRSKVEIRIDVERVGERDDSDIDLQRTPGAYALWPARSEKKNGQVVKPPAPRRKPGTQFVLTLLVAASKESAEVKEVENALRAWILFGGYGGRTRRGLGSLTVRENHREKWLPSAATREAFRTLFGMDIFAAPTNPPKAPLNDVPLLGGAAFHAGKAERDAGNAWTTALNWLKEFRQGTSDQEGKGARVSGKGKPNPSRPSISNWPEADKIRHLSKPEKGLQWAHEPRHKEKPAWPRAGFGLPIIGQFQNKGRNGELYNEPDKFELRWRSPSKKDKNKFDEHDRLASPLIVKALPLADGKFVPCALWLNRAYPKDSEVGLSRPKPGGKPNEKEVDPKTVAPFDQLVADGDTPRFSVLKDDKTLRQAFLDWLHATYKTTVVVP